MRTFMDALGSRWDVTVGHESWGTFVLIFSRRDAPETRRVELAAETAMAAERELDAVTDEQLQARLAQSTPWGG
jgi:hypothetical protein